MEITINIPALETLSKAIEYHANALKSFSSEQIRQGALQHPDEDPKPVTPQPQPQSIVTQQNQLAQPQLQTVPTAAPVQPAPIQQPQQAAPVAQQQSQPLPTTTKQYSFDDLAKAAGQLMDANKQQQLMTLLGQFGIQALTQLPPEQYGNFANALRGLGAQL